MLGGIAQTRGSLPCPQRTLIELAMRIAFPSLCVLLLTAISTSSVNADPVADFYRGQTISLLVGSNTGGGYDSYARPVSRHLGRFIPGEPAIVPRYMGAAGGLPAANSLYTLGSKDGLTIGALQRHTPFEVLRGNKNIVYDPFKFIWLGSLNSEVSVTMVWSSAPHRTAEDLLSMPLIVGSLGQETDSEIETNAMIRLLGAPMHIIRGYSGTADNLLALEKGEIQGLHGVSWSYVKTRKADWLRDGKIRILLQTGIEPHPDLKAVPMVYDLVKSDDVRKFWDLILAPKVMSRPYVLPPGVPAERVAALRTAFERLVQDPAFLAEMQRTGTEVRYMSGVEMERLIARVYAFPPDIVARMNDAISSRLGR
jgi:tripartite-type tricarboxylate transporter receptor subunit TctC